MEKNVLPTFTSQCSLPLATSQSPAGAYVYAIIIEIINPHSGFSLSHSHVKPGKLGFKIFLRLNFLQKIVMTDLPGSRLCPFYQLPEHLPGRCVFISFLPAGFKAETWPHTPEQISNSPNYWGFFSEKIILHLSF